MDFWEFFWLVVWSFFFIAYLMVIFQIFADLVRDKDLAGGWKAVWVVFLLVAPFLGGLVYLIARGRGMSERATAAAIGARREADAYIRAVASSPAPAAGMAPAEQIAEGKKLLDSGAITPTEFDALKAAALA
ncbi:PLDc N-terminal domain-containing protein [Cellulomonas sp. KH9]|uniref:PLDc N-terminal domain-containing protein n=1 Tax=Cellulomonas sp. KH9 TaxID=1855324 RepID=UPI0008F31DC5|nr:PLDc N-terminal domain-containing protein [Cellulomonas sp. KH9]SFJ98927.1 Phospholipase_D-nuclease N-terminal [Cellulomonas sp. KH9]